MTNPTESILFTPPETPYMVDPSDISAKSVASRPIPPPEAIEKPYEWLLFDADETLFAFDSWRGLTHMFAKYDFPFSKEDHEEYQRINKPLWDELQAGIITQEILKFRRFLVWAERVTAHRRKVANDDSLAEISPYELNDSYEDSLAVTTSILPGVRPFLDFLRFNQIKCGIVTNGFNRLQQPRLKHLGLSEGYFDLLVVSETVGVAKPNPLIFHHALKEIETVHGRSVEKERVLMVGDNPHSDVAGGMRSGLDTCWINAHNLSVPEDVTPTYTVANVKELHDALSLGWSRSKSGTTSGSTSEKYFTFEGASSTGNSLKFT